ncbi:MAG: nucleotidyltransferase family protein [Proteobacteria bacterium]|nr:nucleotidyltransferase family protein [Pseudomonadota bacterium]
MKALILAGGRGNRLEPMTGQSNKCMLELGKKPLIEYSLDNACAAGVDEIVIVVGYLAEQIINAYGNQYQGTRIRYVIQWERHGLVHALECAAPVIGDADFILFLADEVLIRPRHAAMIEQFRNEELAVLCGVVTVDDVSQISKTYAIIADESDQRIYRLIEKPARPNSNVMGTGNCIFRNRIFDYITATPINQKRGEKELPDLIQCAVDDGLSVKAFFVGDMYVNINTDEDISRAEGYLRWKP